MPEIKETTTLYLSSWQKRMLGDFMPGRVYRKIALKDITKVQIKFGIIKCPVSYKIPVKGIRKGDWVLYLTDEQMQIVREKMASRIPISSINITNELLENGSVIFS